MAPSIGTWTNKARRQGPTRLVLSVTSGRAKWLHRIAHWAVALRSKSSIHLLTTVTMTPLLAQGLTCDGHEVIGKPNNHNVVSIDGVAYLPDDERGQRSGLAPTCKHLNALYYSAGRNGSGTLVMTLGRCIDGYFSYGASYTGRLDGLSCR